MEAVIVDQKFNQEFDRLGEQAVQRDLQSNKYEGAKLPAAEHCLSIRAFAPQLALAREGNLRSRGLFSLWVWLALGLMAIFIAACLTRYFMIEDVLALLK